MINEPVNQRHMSDNPGASARMTRQSRPPGLATKTAQRTSLGHRFQRALAGGPNRRLPGLHPSPGGAASLSPFLNRRLGFPILAILALLAASLLFLLPGGLAHGQEDGPIEYTENDTGSVATFTATDPEGRPVVYWSLLSTGTPGDITADDYADVAHFSISADGVVNFKFSPDYEMPRGTVLNDTNTNTYRVVVVAADEPLGAAGRVMGYEKVIVNVTDEDEPGMVTLSAEQPQDGISLTATLIDDDASEAQINTAKWEWDHSESKGGPWTAILTATSAEYTPLGVADKYLRATATYTDGHGSDKNAQVVSPHMARAVPDATNAAPVFPDEDSVAGDIQVGRKVDENSPPGTRVGEPVAATDTPGDVLTYTLADGEDKDNYRINPATGQIMTGPRTALDFETNPSDTVMVTATDPAGGTTTQDVTITINDVNEAPMITAGNTRVTIAENADATAQTTAAPTYVAYPEVSVTLCAPAICDWSLTGADAGDFEIGNQTDGNLGQLTFKETPNFEMPADANRDNEYMVTVVVTDKGIDGKGKLSAERDVVVTVTNVNEGMADTVVTLSSLQPMVGIPLTATLDDPDGGEKDIEWQWSIDGANTDDVPGTPDPTPDDDISGATSATYTPKINDVGGTLTATVKYADVLDSGRIVMKAAANPVVQDLATAKAPVFKPKPTSRSVPENYESGVSYVIATVTYTHPNVDAVVTATDPNGDTMTYSLGGTDMGLFSIDEMSGQITVKDATKLDRESKATYRVTVIATDPGNLRDSVDVTIKLTDKDEGPTIAGDDVSRDYPENGTGSVATLSATDPEGRRPVYWSLLSDGTPGDITANDYAEQAHFSISANGVLSFNFPPDYEAPPDTNNAAPNTYRVVVVAADEPQGASNRDLGYKKVTVNVTNVNEPETVTLSRRQAQVGGTELTATYNDPDNERPTGTDLTWRWYLGGSEISGASLATGPSSMYTPVGSGSLRAEASYTKEDGSKKSASATITVRATPTPDNVAPVFPTGTARRSVDENSPPGTRVGEPVEANDTRGDVLTYTLADGGDKDNYRINPATGQIMTGPRTALDFETNPSDTVTVTATDPAGGTTGTATQEVTITINDVNEVPVITAGDTKASVDEPTDNATPQAGATYAAYPEVSVPLCAPATCDWSLKGADAGDFEIGNQADGTLGELTFKETPNFEMPADANRDNEYMVTVVVTDKGIDGKGKLSAERDMVVTVTNVNEPVAGDTTPVVTLSSLQPKVGIPLTATLDDPDGGEKDIEWQWSIDGANTDDVPGTPDPTPDDDISGATSATYTPKINDVGGTLTATVKYADVLDSGRIVMKAAANPVVQDLSAQAPVFKPKPTSRSVPENYESGVSYGTAPDTYTYPAVGAPVTATDPNGAADSHILTYSLGGTDMGLFSIHQGTGQISVKTATKLDRESKATYRVTVTATDPGNLRDFVDVTIKLTEEDEAPEIMVGGLAITSQSARAIDYAENDLDIVDTYGAVGPDAASARWSLSGDDDGVFTIPGGVLAFRNAPDYESPTDMGGDGVYEVTVTAADGTNTATRDVTVTVTNVDELGMISGDATPSYAENKMVSVATYTASGPAAASAEWSLTGVDARDFTITGGVLAFESVPDYENPADADEDNVYEVTITANHGPDTATRDVAVTVTNVDELGMISGDATPSYAENEMGSVATYTASGPDQASAGWSLTGVDAGDFIIPGGVLAFISAPDYESPADADGNNVYKVTVTAKYGTDTATRDVTVTVTNVDELGMISGDAAPSYAEDRTDLVATYTASGPAAAMAEWSLTGVDAGDFTIPGGVLAFISALDYESPADADGDNVYNVTVTANHGPDTATRDVTVTVTGVEEFGVISGNATHSYAENGTGPVATYTATGPDAATWTLLGDDMGDFSIGTDGVLMFTASPNYEAPTDADTNNKYQVTVRGNAGGEMGEVAVTVTVTNVDELGMISGDDALSYAENRTDLVATYAASGPAAAMAEWSLAGNDMDDFSIGTDGVLMFAASPNYEAPTDANTDNVYNVTITANHGPDTATRPVTVTVTDVDELGMISGNATRSYAEDEMGPVATYTTTGPVAPTWTLSGNDMDDFSIGTDGVLMFAASPNYEAPTDANTDNIYQVTVHGNAGGEMDMVAVTVTVTNVDEPGTVTLSEMQPMVGTELTATLAAPAGGVTGETWQWASSDMMDGAYMDITGATMASYTPVAADDGMYLRATVSYSDADGSGKTSMMVSANAVTDETDMDEPGTVTLSEMQPEVGTELTATLADPDGDVTGETWQWASSDMMDGTYTDITGATMASYMPVAADEGMYLRAMVSYSDAEGSDKTAMMVSANPVADPLLVKYDGDKDGWIQLAEARVAVGDYFGPPKGEKLSLDDAREVVGLYFEYLNRQ